MSHCLAEEPGGRATHWVAVHPLAIIRQRFSTQGMLPSWRNAMFADAHHTIGYLSRNKFIQGQKIKPFRHFFACCVGAKVLDHGMNMTCSKRHFMQAPMQALTLLLLGAIEDGGGVYVHDTFVYPYALSAVLHFFATQPWKCSLPSLDLR